MSLLELGSGSLRAEVLPDLGGRIHRLTFNGFDLLRTPPTQEAAYAAPFLWSGFVMAPWANRIPGGSFEWNGAHHTVPVNFHDGSAIHGQVYSRPWDVADDGSLRVSGAPDEFAFDYEVIARAVVLNDTLSYSLELTNRGDVAMPAGLGWHPWFAADDGTVMLQCQPALVYDEDSAHLPVGDPRPIRESDPAFADGFVPQWGYHAVLAGLQPRRVNIRWPRRHISADFTFSATASHVVLYADESLGAVAIEPQSHAPDGHRRASEGLRGGIATLAPGESLTIDYTITVASIAATSEGRMHS